MPKPATTLAESKQERSATVFLENISIRNNARSDSSVQIQASPITIRDIPIKPGTGAEILSSLQFKYGILLNIPVEEMYNYKLIDVLEHWYGTKYRMGGNDKQGIDCSAFVQVFMISMYGLSLPRTARDQYHQTERLKREDLQEGDLVFFKTQRKKAISHVGVYLRNNKFAHASTSSGVMISDLNESYFSIRYAGAGRYVLVGQPVTSQ